MHVQVSAHDQTTARVDPEQRALEFQGGCLCGGVRYTWSGAPEQVTYCHCKMCQRQHGAAFATYARILRANLHVEAAPGQLVDYASSEPVLRRFCKTCGASLFFDYAPMPELIFVAVGTLDDSSDLAPSRHIFLDSKADWLHFNDSLPGFAEYP